MKIDHDVGKVVDWNTANGLSMVHDPKLIASLQITRRRTGYTPDLIFSSQII